MSDQTGEVTEAAPAVRELPAKDDFPAMRVDHYTIRIGDQQYPITAYRPLTDAMANVGDSLTGEFQGADKWDKDRNKFRVKRQTTAVGNPPANPPPPAPAAPPPAPSSSGGTFPPPIAEPVAAPANGTDAARLERLIAIVGAALYFEGRQAADASELARYSLADLYSIADELQHAAANPRPSDPSQPDTRDLPPVG